jgi:hypothetical protein
LNQDRRRRSLTEKSSGVGHTKLVDEGLVTSNVATVCTKRLCKSAHKNVDLSRINTEVIADTSTLHTESTDGMSLVDEQVELVLSLESDDFGEVAHGAFHRVETLDSNENLLPGTVSAGLALGDSLAKNTLQVADVVVLEHFDDSAGKSGAKADGRVVELVRDDEAALSDESREGRGVGTETHGEDGC